MVLTPRLVCELSSLYTVPSSGNELSGNVFNSGPVCSNTSTASKRFNSDNFSTSVLIVQLALRIHSSITRAVGLCVAENSESLEPVVGSSFGNLSVMPSSIPNMHQSRPMDSGGSSSAQSFCLVN